MLQLSLLEWGTFLLLEGNYLEAAHQCFSDACMCARQRMHICVCLWVHKIFNNDAWNLCDLRTDAFLWYILYILAFFSPLLIFWFVLEKDNLVCGFFFFLFFLFRSTNPVPPCLMTHSLLLHTKHPFNSLAVKTLGLSLGHKVIVFISLGARPWDSSTDKLAVVLNEQLHQGNINLGA